MADKIEHWHLSHHPVTVRGDKQRLYLPGLPDTRREAVERETF